MKRDARRAHGCALCQGASLFSVEGDIAGGLFGASHGHGKMGAYAIQGRIAGKTVVSEKAWDAMT